MPFNEKTIKNKLGTLGGEPKPSAKQMKDKGFSKDKSGNWGKKK
jgi:hypothetical protein